MDQYLVHLEHHLRQERVQGGELPAEVDVPLKSRRVGDRLRVRDFEQEALHVGPLVLQELVHEGHVLFLVTKSGKQREMLLKKHPQLSAKKTSICPPCIHSLGEVRQVLGDFSDERERPCCAVVRVLLHQVEK